VNRLLAKPLLHRAVDHALQSAAVDRKLRHIMAGTDAARLAPDFLAVAVEVIELVGTNSDIVEFLQQPEAREFPDRMRQGVDADTELSDLIGLLEFSRRCRGPAASAQWSGPRCAANDNRLHRPKLHARPTSGASVARRAPPQAGLSPPRAPRAGVFGLGLISGHGQPRPAPHYRSRKVSCP
jgi:hypothetical protein